MADEKSKKAKEIEEAKAKVAERKAEKKEAKEKAATEKKEAKEKASEEKQEAKDKEVTETRQKLLDSGDLILHEDAEFYASVKDEEKDYTLDERAVVVLEDLKASKVPLMGKDLQDKHGGGWPLYIPMFSMLKAQGLIKEYRRRTGERGGGGKAYLYTG